MKSSQSVTSLPASPVDERKKRMQKYLIMMSVRIVCLVLMLFVKGWWLAVVAAGAILLPYFAVVIGNVGTSTLRRHERPTEIEVYRPQAAGPGSEEPRS
jgi:heme O synthase-like polyprenyltransferase